MKFSEFLAQDRRLVILKLLMEAQGVANESVMRTALLALGHGAGLTHDALRADLDFLKESGCVRLEWFADKVAVAKITKRGVDAAEGRVTVDGVKPPSLGV